MKDPRTDSKIDLASIFKIKSKKRKKREREREREREGNIQGPNWISKLNSYT